MRFDKTDIEQQALNELKEETCRAKVEEAKARILAKHPLVRTQALVLPEEDVDALLAKILEKQQAAKMDYFTDLVRKEGAQEVPSHRFHAQIISLRAA